MRPNLFEREKTLSATTSIEALFDGPKDFAAIVAERIVRIKQQAEKDGYRKALKEVNDSVKKMAEDYIFTISRIVTLVHQVKNANIKDDVEIIDSRARFCLDTEWIDINFVIKADRKNEVKFSTILTEVKKDIFGQINKIAELFFVNEKQGAIDYSLLKNDYPFVVKPIELKS